MTTVLISDLSPHAARSSRGVRRPAASANRGAHQAAGERGYALLLVMFLAAVMLILATRVTLNALTEGRRQREEEMIWRGEQYERGVKLFYHKKGSYPHTVDDLVKGTPGIRYMRKAYPDMSNPGGDGKWRLIYVTGAGTLIGSVRYTSLAQMYAAQHPGQAVPFGVVPGGIGLGQGGGSSGSSGPTGATGSQTSGPSGASGSTGSQSSNTDPSQSGASGGTGQGQTGSTGGFPPDQGASGFTGIFGGTGLEGLQPMPLATTGPVIGGSLIGVGANEDIFSIKVYKGGKKYKQWEFIWSPLEEAAAAQAQGGGFISPQPGGSAPNPGGIGINPSPSPSAPTPPAQPTPPATPPSQ